MAKIKFSNLFQNYRTNQRKYPKVGSILPLTIAYTQNKIIAKANGGLIRDGINVNIRNIRGTGHLSLLRPKLSAEILLLPISCASHLSLSACLLLLLLPLVPLFLNSGSVSAKDIASAERSKQETGLENPRAKNWASNRPGSCSEERAAFDLGEEQLSRVVFSVAFVSVCLVRSCGSLRRLCRESSTFGAVFDPFISLWRLEMRDSVDCFVRFFTFDCVRR